MEDKVAMLRRIPLFAAVRASDLEALALCLGKRTFGKGMVIFHRDSPGQTLYIVESGMVRIFSLSEAGQEITVNIYGPGEMFGEMAVLDRRPRSAGAICMERTVTLTLHRDDFVRCLERSRTLVWGVIELLISRLRYTTIHAESMAFLDVYGRVAAKLLELDDRFGASGGGAGLGIQLTQAELATWVSASRESVNKVLGSFKEQGYISLDSDGITLLDRIGLRGQVRY
jgi:CRP-like cAMP-binding protein